MEISLDNLTAEIQSNCNRDLIFFVGSAISMFEPTNIPSGSALNLNIFRALTKSLPKDKKDKYDEIFENNQDPSRGLVYIPLERTLSYIWSSLNKSQKKKFFKQIDLFVKANPNEIHKILTEMVSKSNKKTIITTNFDLALEKAFNGGEKEVVTKKNIQKIKDNVLGNGIRIIKLHGSWDNPKTTTFTLEQEGRGLHYKLREYLKKNLTNKIVCFIGYSASDFDIFPILYEINFEKLYWLIKTKRDANNRIEKIINKKPGSYFKCFGNIEDLYNKLTDKKLTNTNKNKEYKKLIDFLSEELNLPQKYLLIAKIFHILLKIDIAIEVLEYALENLCKENCFKEYKDELVYWLASSYNQKGNLKKANCYYKQYLEQIKESHKEDKKLFDAKLSLVSSYIMMGYFEKAKNGITEIKNILENSQNTSKKFIKCTKEIEVRLKDLINKVNYFNIVNELSSGKLPPLDKLEVEIHELQKCGQRKGNLDLIMDCNMYLSRLKSIQKDYNGALKLLDTVIEFYEFSGNVLAMINAMRDKSKVKFSKKERKKAIRIHEEILKISRMYGLDYLTRIKSYFYLSCYNLKFKFHKSCLFLLKAITLIIYCLLTNKVPLKLFFIYFKNVYNCYKIEIMD